ncbi:hypothetical protein RhiirB3_495079 [Rhizophagus irregularis]|nr:hypothetical protein RhiirB3_495079 [Rhizophagus irregularis]
MISLEKVDIINKSSSEVNGDYSSGIYQSVSNSSDVSCVISDINENLSIGSNINLSSDDSKQNFSSVQSNILESNITDLSNISIKVTELLNNTIKLEEDGFTVSDRNVMSLIKNLNETKCLYSLKLLFEDMQNEFSNKILIDSLIALADPTPFNLYYSKETINRLELQLRTWVAVLERICFSPIRLTKEFRDKIYNSLAKFAEIHQKTTQIIKGSENNFEFNLNRNESVRNYNIDFLLIHMRDTLNSLRDDETWFQEIIRKIKESLKVALNIVPGVLSSTPGATIPNDNCSILSMLTQLRQEIDFDQYIQKLNENKLAKDNFQYLLTFIKEKCLKDFNISNNAEINKGKEKGKGKSLDQNYISNYNILYAIADEITCPISSEPADQLCIFKCQHIISLNNFKKLKQKKCPKCREKFIDNDIRYISQNTIYKNLYSHLFEAGYILSSIELEDTDNHYNNDLVDNSEADLILTKKKKSIKATKLSSNISLQSIFPKILKRQHPFYLNIIKELNEKNYNKAEYYCKELLKTFPTNYNVIKCILAYTYRCLNNYEQAHLYLKEVIDLKEKHPVAYFIRGEIFFRQKKYKKAIKDLIDFKNCNVKTNNLYYIILGNSYLLEAISCNDYNYLSDALNYYIIALRSNPNSYFCLKNCAYIYERQKDYSNTFEMLDKLLSINKEDSLILCYYGEILNKVKKYSNAISYFTKANIIDPENVHNLNKRAIAYFIIQEYDKSLFDLNKTIQLNPLNSIAYYYKALVYIMELNCISYDNKESRYYLVKTLENVTNTMTDFGRCIESDLDFWSHLYKTHQMENISFNCIGIINNFNKYMYKVHNIYFVSNYLNLDDKYNQFKENEINSYWIIWKINIKELLSKICFIKFKIKESDFVGDKIIEWEHVLEYEDLSKLEGLGWIEYKLPYNTYYKRWVQPSIEVNDGHIDMRYQSVFTGGMEVADLFTFYRRIGSQ